MENGTTHTNGKSQSNSPLFGRELALRPGLAKVVSPNKFDKVLDLVRDIAHLELTHKEKMVELEQEMQAVGHGELPSVLMSLVRHHAAPEPAPVPPQPPKPAPKPTAPRQNRPVKNKGGAWKAKVMGLMADKQERKSLDIVKQLKAENPTTIYSILSELAREGHLIRTRFAHYRLKLRK